MSLRLVVDRERPWRALTPELGVRARARNAEIDALTAPRVRAARATKAGEEREPRRGAAEAQAGDEPRAGVQNNGRLAMSAAPTTGSGLISAVPGAARPSVPLSPSSSGRWLLAVPYLTGATAALVGWLLAYVFGGVR